MRRGARRRRWVLGSLCLGSVLFVGTTALQRTVRTVGDAMGHPAPALPAPLFDIARTDPTFEAPATPATEAGERVVAALARVERRQRRTRYQHHTSVDEARGRYLWDCSGMTNWVLGRAAPRSLRGLGASRPRAMRYARVIERAPTTRPRRGWQRVPIAEVRPGDVFAWETPIERFRRHATGHVGFVVSAPERVHDDLWAVRIVDSTSGPHQDDTRPWDGVGGTGRGTMTFQTDARGDVVAYGWWGTESPAYVRARVVFGRVH